MSSISPSSADNYGGLLTIRYALASQVAAIISALDIPTGGISLSQAAIDANFFTISAMHDNSSHQEPDQLTQHGQQYNQTVSCRLAGDRAEIRAQKRLVANRGLVLLITDHNGLTKLVGTPAEPLRQSDDRRTGIRIPDTNGSNLTFTGLTSHPAPVVTIT